jgi:uncharacterized membrane protein YkoI
MSREKPSTLKLLATALVSAALAVAVPLFSLAKSYDDEETTALLQALNNSKVSTAEGVQQLTKGSEAAISAKYEFDDNKKLSLSVYTAEKGLAEDPEHNVLKEFSGSPEKAPWAPEAEVFKDIPHASRASGQLTLMAAAKHSLADFITMAQKKHKGKVFSANPEIQNHRPVLVVLIADKDKVNEVRYDLETGHVIAAK